MKHGHPQDYSAQCEECSNVNRNSFFTAQEFEQIWLEFQNECKSGSVYDLYALRANDKLAREGKYVGGSWARGGLLGNTDLAKYIAKHCGRGLFLNIEPIQACKHPPEKIKTNYSNFLNRQPIHFCECGAKLKPVAYEEIDE